MPITHGMVKITERRKIGDYEHKEAVAEVGYTVDESEDAIAMANNARVLAAEQIEAILRHKIPTPPKPVIQPEPDDAPGQAPARRGPGRPPKVKPEEVLPVPTSSANPVVPKAPETDPMTEIFSAEPEKPIEITDDTLRTHCMKRLAEVKEKTGKHIAMDIRGLVSRYVPDGMSPSAALIPMDKRPAFITELGGLQ